MLCSMKELMAEAAKKNAAVSSFSVYNMETVKGVIQAAEEAGIPVIIQIAESRFPYAPLELMAPMMVNAAREAKVKIAVHLDHGLHLETVQKALDYGFTSVMFDGSQMPLEENIRLTKEAVRMAAAYDAAVEGEIGCVGGNEGMGDIQDRYTRPEEAARFARETGVDALAISIGNAHGNYRMMPKLQFEILEKIRQEVECPLVLHGGSGIPDEDFMKAIDRGIRKINIATALLNAQTKAAEEILRGEKNPPYFMVSDRMVQEVAKCARIHIHVFQNKQTFMNSKEERVC